MKTKTGNSLMTAPVLASRTPVFAPSLKGGMTDWAIETVYGKASVKGNLTQIHRNILDAVFGFAIDTRQFPNGSIEILVDPYVVATKTGSSRDYEWLKTKLHDMKVADVDIVDLKSGLHHHGGIVSEWREAKHRVPLPGGALKGDRVLLAVTISAAWMRIYQSTLTVGYRDLIPAIAKLESGVLQALVRYCLTQQELNKKLNDLLTDIGAISSESSKRKCERARQTVIDADLSLFGIFVRNDIVYYKKHESVKFKNPSNCEVPTLSMR